MSVEIRLTIWHDCTYPKSGNVIQPPGSLLVSIIIRPELLYFKEDGTKVTFLLMQGWSDFAVFGNRQTCETLVLGEIKNNLLNTLPV